MLDDLKAFARYASGLRSFLKRPLTSTECRRIIEHQFRAREESFLRILELAVFASPHSPYYKLLARARIEFRDVTRSVGRDGIEATLATLYQEGVYVTLDEFKGRRGIERSGLTLSVQPTDFDNPLLLRHYEGRTGGSRGAGQPLHIDFDLLSHEAAYYSLFLGSFDVAERLAVLWYPVPPTVAGMKQALRCAKLGKPPARWFTQRLPLGRQTLKHFVFTWCTIYGSRLWGRRLPVPEHVPLEESWRIAEWLAAQKRQGVSAVLAAFPSSVVRVCMAARERGLDISGTFFRLGGEPYTPAKARIVAETGCAAGSAYSMSEIGSIGMGCAVPTAVDEVHMLSDKVAAIQIDRAVGDGGIKVGALFYTTLLPSCPKLMLNVESDDYGVLAERRCGCPFGEIGFHRHLHSIRSYDKLTSEGMTFLGSELISLVEEILPVRFGGYPADYQFVEVEEAGLAKVNLIVSPRVGDIDTRQVVSTVLESLGSHHAAQKMMADLWSRTDALRVVRREPYPTGAAKILPLHILRGTPVGRER